MNRPEIRQTGSIDSCLLKNNDVSYNANFILRISNSAGDEILQQWNLEVVEVQRRRAT